MGRFHTTMPCVLRIGGAELDVDELLRAVPLSAYRIDRKGASQRLASRGPYEESAIHVDVSQAAFEDLPGQLADALAFLTRNADALRQAVGFPGVERATLDFAIAARDVAIDSSYLPPEVLRTAGNLGIGIELS